MDVQRVRIDASLYPVVPRGSTRITSYQERFRQGDFDHLHPETFSHLSVAIRRALLLDTAAFNTELNRMLRQYGLFVTNIAEGELEYALAYLEDYRTQDALAEAKRMRDWFLPAATAYHQIDQDHLAEVEELLNDGVLVTSVQ